MVPSLEENSLVTHAVLGKTNKTELAEEYRARNVVVWSEEEFLLNCRPEDKPTTVLKPPEVIVL